MTNLSTIPLHELLAIAAHKARSHMGEGRHMVSFQELLEQAARFADAARDGNFAYMEDEAYTMTDSVSDIRSFVEDKASAAEAIDWNREEGFARFPGMAL